MGTNQTGKVEQEVMPRDKLNVALAELHRLALDTQVRLGKNDPKAFDAWAGFADAVREASENPTQENIDTIAPNMRAAFDALRVQ